MRILCYEVLTSRWVQQVWKVYEWSRLHQPQGRDLSQLVDLEVCNAALLQPLVPTVSEIVIFVDTAKIPESAVHSIIAKGSKKTDSGFGSRDVESITGLKPQ